MVHNDFKSRIFRIKSMIVPKLMIKRLRIVPAQVKKVIYLMLF